MDTQQLISNLCQDPSSKRMMQTPAWYAVRLIAVLGLYAIAAQVCLHIRPDIAVQLARPNYTIEIVLLLSLIISSAIAAILSMYPDMHQKPWVLKVPYVIFTLLALFVLSQIAMAHDDPRMALPPPGAHAMQCTLCIGTTALLPAAIIFALIRRGASLTRLHSGAFAVLSATGIGCLTLRLSEANDSLMHLATWHYLPTLLFALIGAMISKRLLSW